MVHDEGVVELDGVTGVVHRVGAGDFDEIFRLDRAAQETLCVRIERRHVDEDVSAAERTEHAVEMRKMRTGKTERYDARGDELAELQRHDAIGMRTVAHVRDRANPIEERIRGARE